MAEFGKRRSMHAGKADDRSTAASADLATAVAAVQAGRLPHWAKTGPLRMIIVLLAAIGCLYAMVFPYAGELARDFRLAGTWQPAYDMQATAGRCTRHQFLLTFCDVTLRSRPEPGRAPLAISYMMAFSGGGGERLVPVRSTVDPSAVTIAYAAQAQLTNRILTLLAVAGGFAAIVLAAADALLRGRYVGGAAHRALMAGLEELKSRVGAAHAPPRVTA